MNRPIIFVAALLGILIGMAFIMPAVAQLRLEGALPAWGVALLILGLALTAAGSIALAYGVKRLRA